MTAEQRRTEFQTPPCVCDYMVSLIPAGTKTVLEPTPGEGNLLRAAGNYLTTGPDNFFTFSPQRFDCVIMNPPFSKQYTINLPEQYNKKSFQVGYHILTQCMEMSDSIIALLPWFVITNSAKRLYAIERWGLKSVTALPRVLFPGSRSSNCILELSKGYAGITHFKSYKL